MKSPSQKKLTSKFLIFLKGICILTIITPVIYLLYTHHATHVSSWTYDAHKEISQLKSNPEIYSSFTLHGDSVYFGTIAGDTYSLNDMTGKLKWKHQAYDYSIYPAAFDDNGLMYVSNFDGRIYAINAETGIEKWRLALSDYFRIDTEPVVSDGMVYAGSRDGTFYALDKKDGAVLWTFKTSQIHTSHHNPEAILIHFGLFTVDDRYVFINSAPDNRMYSLDKKTGNLNWAIDTQEFVYQKPVVFSDSIAFWDSPTTYHLVSKKTGKIIRSIIGDKHSILEGESSVFAVDPSGTVECINTSSGVTSWSFTSNDPFISMLKIINGSTVMLMQKNMQSDIFTLLNGDDGKLIWSQSFAQNQQYSIFYDANHIYAVGTNTQCAVTHSGKISWCSSAHTRVFNSFYTTGGIFLVAGAEEKPTIILVDSASGNERWRHQVKSINNRSIQIHKNNMYFTTKENNSVVMLNAKHNTATIQDRDIQSSENNLSIFQKTKNTMVTILRRIPFSSVFVSNTPMEVTVPREIVDLYGIFELNILLDESIYTNKFSDANIEIAFVDPNGVPYTTRAFYYDQGFWKARFSPHIKGVWKWKITNANLFMTSAQSGSFMVVPSEKAGFISLSKNDPRLFVNTAGKIFTPIGIQICVYDLNQDGDPINQWPLNSADRVTSEDASFPTTTMNKFIAEHATSGFNFFRWGDNNCSFSLWKTLSIKGNIYMVNEGTYLDKMFHELRAHKQHIWMSLLSFDYPFDKTLPMKHQKEILRKYIDYVVARYASYVDVWEIANEIHLDTQLLQYAATYLRSIDPYKHPITTSWERPDLKEIEIVSYHWYPGECNEYCHEDFRRQFVQFEKLTKPVVVTEQGNLHNSWDEYSGARYRVRLWFGFFNKVSLILWGMPNKHFENKEGPSNIYVSPVERKYTQVFSNFISQIDSDLKEHSIRSTNKQDISYAATSGKTTYGYIYRKIINAPTLGSTVIVSFPRNGTVEWVDPTNGDVLATTPASAGDNTLRSPSFSVDIAFRYTESQ